MSKLGALNKKDWLPYQNYTQLKGFFVECPTNCWDESHHQKRTSTRARRIAKLLLQGCSSGKTPILLAPKILTVDHLEFFLPGCRVSYQTRKVVSHDTCNYLKSPCDSARFESSPMSSWLATLVTIQICCNSWQHSRFVVGLSHYWYFKGHFGTHLLTTWTDQA